MRFTLHGNRLFEWMSASMLLGVALILTYDPSTLVDSQFVLLSRVGYTPFVVTSLGFVFGTVRISALVVNGFSVKWGPVCRMAASLFSALLWGLMCYSSLEWFVMWGYTLSLGVPIFFFLMVGELISAHRAASDADISVR